MFIPRQIATSIQKALSHFPVVLVTGPRQSGKTELLKHMYPGWAYHTFDALDVRQKAVSDPRALFEDTNSLAVEKNPSPSSLTTPHKIESMSGLILDEIQEVPELLSYVKEWVDQDRRPGQMILTGSHQFKLMEGVTESLAGRVAIVELLPFSHKELRAYVRASSDQKTDTPQPLFDIANLSSVLHKGLYPQVQISKGLELDLWFSSYVNTYIERDVRQQLAIRDLRSFEAFLKLLASRVGQELNLNALSKQLGVTVNTLKSWLSVLQAAYIVYLLPPYFENFGKRVIKSPKLYFVDTGLVCYLTRITDSDSLIDGPLGGALFENFVVMELYKQTLNRAQTPSLYFWRSHDGLEVDLLSEASGKLDVFEVKRTHTVTEKHTKSLQKFEQISQKPIRSKIMISQSKSPQLPQDFKHWHWSKMGDKS